MRLPKIMSPVSQILPSKTSLLHRVSDTFKLTFVISETYKVPFQLFCQVCNYKMSVNHHKQLLTSLL